MFSPISTSHLTLFPALYTYYNIVLSTYGRKTGKNIHKKKRSPESDPMTRFYFKKKHFYLDKVFILLYCVKYNGVLLSVPSFLRRVFEGEDGDKTNPKRK